MASAQNQRVLKRSDVNIKNINYNDLLNVDKYNKIVDPNNTKHSNAIKKYNEILDKCVKEKKMPSFIYQMSIGHSEKNSNKFSENGKKDRNTNTYTGESEVIRDRETRHEHDIFHENKKHKADCKMNEIMCSDVNAKLYQRVIQVPYELARFLELCAIYAASNKTKGVILNEKNTKSEAIKRYSNLYNNVTADEMEQIGLWLLDGFHTSNPEFHESMVPRVTKTKRAIAPSTKKNLRPVMNKVSVNTSAINIKVNNNIKNVSTQVSDLTDFDSFCGKVDDVLAKNYPFIDAERVKRGRRLYKDKIFGKVSHDKERAHLYNSYVGHFSSTNNGISSFEKSYTGQTTDPTGRKCHHSYEMSRKHGKESDQNMYAFYKSEKESDPSVCILNRYILVNRDASFDLETCVLAALKDKKVKVANVNMNESEYTRVCKEYDIKDLNEIIAIGEFVLCGFLFGHNIMYDKYHYVCLICTERFLQKGHFLNHMNKLHKIEEEQCNLENSIIPSIKCPMCRSPYINRETLRSHLKNVHKKSRQQAKACTQTDYDKGRELMASHLCPKCHGYYFEEKNRNCKCKQLKMPSSSDSPPPPPPPQSHQSEKANASVKPATATTTVRPIIAAASGYPGEEAGGKPSPPSGTPDTPPSIYICIQLFK